MIHIFFLLITFLFAWPAFAVTSCPSGMVLAKTSANPILDCVCFGGQRPRMNISSTGNPTALFGSCPNSQTFYPSPTVTGGVSSVATGNFQSFIVPQTGLYTIEVWGAQGGQSGTAGIGGKGAYVRGEVSLTVGTTLTLLVAQQGENDPFTQFAGGGGGSFVMQSSTALFVAGGGSGGGTAQGAAGLDASNPGTGHTINSNGSGGGWLDAHASTGYYSSPSSSGSIHSTAVAYSPPTEYGTSVGTGLNAGSITASTSGTGGGRDGCTTGGGVGGFGGGGGAVCSASQKGAGGGYTGGYGSAPGGSSYITSSAL